MVEESSEMVFVGGSESVVFEHVDCDPPVAPGDGCQIAGLQTQVIPRSESLVGNIYDL